MKIDKKFPLVLAAYITAFTVIGGAGWAVGEVTELRPALLKELKIVMDMTETNVRAIARSDFNILNDRLKLGGDLSWDEKRDYCTNALILKYPVGELLLKCTQGGEPDLVTRAKP